MLYYRLYELNAHSLKIEGVTELHAADDADATAQARGRVSVRPRELWRGNRKVWSDTPTAG
ncbi:MAG: hypothetical protein ACT4OE_00140 [Sphingosinicella sp.]